MNLEAVLGRYRPLLVDLALRYTTSENDTDDLIQVGRIGIWKALPHYNPSKGRLSTYLYRCAANAMFQEVTSNNGLVHLPRDRSRRGERRYVRVFSAYEAHGGASTNALAAHAYDRWRKLHTYLSSC